MKDDKSIHKISEPTNVGPSGNDIMPGYHHEELHNSANQILAYGPRKTGPNIMINKSGNCSFKYETSLENGFQLASLAGPLCEEPLMGCAFVLTDFTLDESSEEINTNDIYGPLSGQIVSVVKDLVHS